MNIKQKKAALVAALENNPGMGISEMMSYQLSESMCYKLRRQVRAIKASKETIRKIPKAKRDAVIDRLKNSMMTCDQIRDEIGISANRITIIARDARIDMQARSIRIRRKPRKPSKGSGNGHVPMVLGSLSGDGMSFEWARYNWGCKPGTRRNYWGCGV